MRGINAMGFEGEWGEHKPDEAIFFRAYLFSH
jgi:hypothetical protein